MSVVVVLVELLVTLFAIGTAPPSMTLVLWVLLLLHWSVSRWVVCRVRPAVLVGMRLDRLLMTWTAHWFVGVRWMLRLLNIDSVRNIAVSGRQLLGCVVLMCSVRPIPFVVCIPIYLPGGVAVATGFLH